MTSEVQSEPEHHEHHHPTAHEVERWALEGVLSIIALAWTVILLAIVALLVWPEGASKVPGLETLVRDMTAWALVITLVGVGLAALATLAGARHVGPVTLVVSIACTIVVLTPIVGMWRIAQDHDASISLFENLTSLSNEGRPVPERSVTYATVGGQDLALDVWVPGSTTGAPIPGAAAGARRPAVVMVHGGGWVGGDRGPVPQWNQLFNERGYAVFDIQYRLATDTLATWNLAASDVLCSVGWVKAHAGDYGVDPSRVALFGASAGGELVLQAAYGTSGQPTVPSCPTPDPSVKAVVSLYPGTEFVSLWGSPDAPPIMPLWVQAYQGGTPTDVPDHYEGSSPVKQVRAGAAPPTLLMHGLEDDVVPVDQTDQMDAALTRLGIEHETITMPIMEHAFDHAWHSLGTQIARDVVPRYLDQHVAS